MSLSETRSHDPQVLLTGATGLIGSHVLSKLLARGERVRVFALPETISQIAKSTQVDIVTGSLTGKSGLDQAVRGIRTVYHLAGLMPGHPKSELFRLNVSGTRNLLQACSKVAINRFVYLSSVAVYGRPPWPFLQVISENSPRRPHGISEMRGYGESKMAAEDLIIDSHGKYRFEYVILRPTVVYAPGVRFVERILRNIVHAPRLAIAHAPFWGDMQWVHISDLVTVTIEAGVRRTAANQVFNVAGSEHTTIWGLATIVAEITGSVPVQPLPPDPVRGYPLKFDTAKAEALLNYAPKMRLRQGLVNVLAAMKLLPASAEIRRKSLNTDHLMVNF